MQMLEKETNHRDENAFVELISRLDTTEKQISKTEDRSIGQQTEIIQTETHTHTKECVWDMQWGLKRTENQNRASKNRD